MTILAIDGGDKNVGYALFAHDGTELARGVIDFETFDSRFWLGYDRELIFSAPDSPAVSEITQLVVEGYRHDPNVKQGGSVHGASQVEGAVKILGAVTAVPVTVQYAGQALPVAKQITGYTGDLTKTGKVDEDGILTCSMHDWKWDLKTGKCLSTTGHAIRATKVDEVTDAAMRLGV